MSCNEPLPGGGLLILFLIDFRSAFFNAIFGFFIWSNSEPRPRGSVGLLVLFVRGLFIPGGGGGIPVGGGGGGGGGAILGTEADGGGADTILEVESG